MTAAVSSVGVMRPLAGGKPVEVGMDRDRRRDDADAQADDHGGCGGGDEYSEGVYDPAYGRERITMSFGLPWRAFDVYA
jgi:hypothetical protein